MSCQMDQWRVYGTYHIIVVLMDPELEAMTLKLENLEHFML